MSFNFHKLSILVVEDIRPMQKLIVTVLKTLGVGAVHTAEDGEQGFIVFCRENPDIILCDWHMTPVSGIDLIQRIRNDKKSPNKMVPVIMMSGYNAVARIACARDVGVTEFLVKPFSAADLTRRITYVINKPRDFIQSPEYFGPDRRRKPDENYRGEKKRAQDDDAGDDTEEVYL